MPVSSGNQFDACSSVKRKVRDVDGDCEGAGSGMTSPLVSFCERVRRWRMAASDSS